MEHVILFNPKIGIPKVCGAESKLDVKEIVQAIGCDLFDVVRLPHNIFILCDDEGMLISGNVVTEIKLNVYGKDHKFHLAGNLLFCTEKDSEFVALSKEQCNYILNEIGLEPVGEVK